MADIDSKSLVCGEVKCWVYTVWISVRTNSLLSSIYNCHGYKCLINMLNGGPKWFDGRSRDIISKLGAGALPPNGRTGSKVPCVEDLECGCPRKLENLVKIM